MTSSESTHLPLREMADLGGVSGGPMISLITGKVHTVLSTSGAGYAVCCDIRGLPDGRIRRSAGPDASQN